MRGTAGRGRGLSGIFYSSISTSKVLTLITWTETSIRSLVVYINPK